MKHLKLFEDYDCVPCEAGEEMDPRKDRRMPMTEIDPFEGERESEDEGYEDFSEEEEENRPSFGRPYNEAKKQAQVSYAKSGLKNPAKADRDKNKKISGWEKATGKAIEKSMGEKTTSAQKKKLPAGLLKAIEAKKKKKK